MLYQMTAGHEETQLDIPDPLGSARSRNPFTSALPSHVLSWISILVLVAVLALLADGKVRHLFQLPFDPAWLAGAATLLAGGVLLTGRSRPGRLFPRLWSLALTSLAALVGLLDVWASDSPYLHLSSLALLASAVSLLPRLVSIRPDSAWIQRLAPVSFFVVLVLVLLASYVVRRQAVEAKGDEIESFLSQIEAMTETVRNAARHDWARMWNGKDAAREQVDALEKLKLPGAYQVPAFWKAAEALGRNEEVEEAVLRLADAVVDALDPEITPKLSSSPKPAIWWDPTPDRWQEEVAVSELAPLVGRYHEALGGLFKSLELTESTAKKNAPLKHVAEGYGKAKGVLAGHLQTALQGWSDRWAVLDLAGRPGFRTDDLLLTPIVGGEQKVVPAELRSLLHLPLFQGKALVAGNPGCRSHEQVRGDDTYCRIDCYAYRPGMNGSHGADLHLDLRVVYHVGYGLSLGRHLLPTEVSFYFPIPPEAVPEEFQEETLDDFREAVGEGWSITNRYANDPTKGFIMKKDRDTLAVVAALEDRHFKHGFLAVRAYVNPA